ncbi:homeobox-like domain superfamily [Holotrichia oblita]|uniref:Homeobox-like domain superfamily n=1 Tax=Holotrichia oblita TaxID=644536 RepID=A0ACB9TI72_HOLOL|nr:homeobox-like domain superfamily [Holotrichia oblita]
MPHLTVLGKPYIRSTKRQEWSEESLRQAIENVSRKQMGVNEASREFGIPSRTLRRHLASGKLKPPLGRSCELGLEHETRLVNHVKALEKVGFAPDRNDVRKMAYEFAEKLGIQHRFSHGTKSAGYDWFNGFIRRNKNLSLRKSEGHEHMV